MATTSPESVALSKALKKQGFAFVGPTTMFALMEAIGIFDPHLVGCHRRADAPGNLAPMTRVHAFADDALGAHDTVGLVEALHSGAVSVREVVEAAIARVERVNPELNAVAFTRLRPGPQRGPRARAAASSPAYRR